MTAAPRPSAVDVSGLPSTVFGSRGIMWWGTLGFMAIEGMTTAVAIASYFYLHKNFETWPPLRTPLPSLLAATLKVAVMLVSLIPARAVDRAARRRDLAAVQRGMAISTVIAWAIIALQVFEFAALHTRWDTNAYGSVAWLVLASFSTVLLTDVLDTTAFAVLLYVAPHRDRDFSSASDNSFYWYYTVALAIVVYAVVFLSPRVI